MNLGKVYYKNIPIRRIIKKFAFFPIILSNNDRIWWESYYSYEQYGYRGMVLGGWDMGSPKWHSDFSSSSIKEIRDFLRIDYRENKKSIQSTKEFFEILERAIKA